MSEITLIVEQISRDLMNRISNIIENELKMVCKEHGVPPEKIILQCYPEGTYSIAVIVSQFKINNEFTYQPTQS